MEIDIKEFAFFVRMIEDKLDGGERISRTECLEAYRTLAIRIHEERLEDQYPFFHDCMVGEYKVARDDFVIIEDFMINSKKINAIKHMRAATGVGLKEAKQSVEFTFPEITAPIDQAIYNANNIHSGEMKWPRGTGIDD